jgi:hypothetical protein
MIVFQDHSDGNIFHKIQVSIMLEFRFRQGSLYWKNDCVSYIESAD